MKNMKKLMMMAALFASANLVYSKSNRYDVFKPTFDAMDRQIFDELSKPNVLRVWCKCKYPSDAHPANIKLCENGISTFLSAVKANQEYQEARKSWNIIRIMGAYRALPLKYGKRKPYQTPNDVGKDLFRIAGLSKETPSFCAAYRLGTQSDSFKEILLNEPNDGSLPVQSDYDFSVELKLKPNASLDQYCGFLLDWEHYATQLEKDSAIWHALVGALNCNEIIGADVIATSRCGSLKGCYTLK